MAHEVWMGLQLLQEESHEYALRQGFWKHEDVMLDRAGGVGEEADRVLDACSSEKIALMHSELSEALDALRDGDMAQVAVELADCVIRIADFCERRGLSLSQARNIVMAKSRDRPPMHGRRW